jgi:hypothetical protein
MRLIIVITAAIAISNPISAMAGRASGVVTKWTVLQSGGGAVPILRFRLEVVEVLAPCGTGNFALRLDNVAAQEMANWIRIANATGEALEVIGTNGCSIISGSEDVLQVEKQA